jgi:hypothetical protein
MNRRLDGKIIQPNDLTPKVYEGSSIVEHIVLATSNHLRTYFALKDNEIVSGLIPKFVTRKNPSLDNYFAELLLRTCYSPVDYLPIYEEHVIRGSQEELPSNLNPRLVDAILLGIGGMSNNPDFRKVYDEHSGHGTRSAKSVTQVVYEEHLAKYSERVGIKSIWPILEEINYIDSEGGAPYDHIFNITKSLNIAQFKQPGFVSECLEPQWKRAIIGAILMSVCVSVSAFENYDNEKALADLEQEWALYQKKSEKMIQGGFLEKVDPEAAKWVKERILNPKQSELKGKPIFFSLRKMLFALRNVWHPQVTSFLVGFLFESMLQAQQSFLQILKQEIPFRALSGSYAFIYYQKQPQDKMPNRGLLLRMNEMKKKAAIVVFDPVRQITGIFCNRFMPKKVWANFIDLLIENEGDEVWYVPTQDTGEYASFVLNGTESFVGVPMSALSENDLLELFREAIKQ